jgi:hypothetical protein
MAGWVTGGAGREEGEELEGVTKVEVGVTPHVRCH